jgi:hypothetical protein
MSSGSHKPGLSTKPATGSFATAPQQSNQTLLLERVGARTSTPDSEALASSDDEGDHRQGNPQPLPQKPVRRSSWLNDTSQPFSRPRKGSFASSSMSPTGSNPSTPSVETGAGPWAPHSATATMGRVAGSNSLSWGSGIWTERKEPPLRLSEVLPSPTSSGPGNGSMFMNEGAMAPGSPASQGNPQNAQIPFAIPLHPTPKTYRSQSYSVGQLEPDANPLVAMASAAVPGRARHPALQHRPSRPSMLSEMSNDGSLLGKVKEVDDDDDESTTESMHNSFHQTSESKTIEMLARENAILRQAQQVQQQQYNSRIRPRVPTTSQSFNTYSMQDPVPEESDFAVDELDEHHEAGDPHSRRTATRRMSEYSMGAIRSPLGLDGRKTDNTSLKKAIWSSSLGFPLEDISQSRRHSFANMPTRHGSIASITDANSLLEQSTDGQMPQDFSAYPIDTLGYPNNGSSLSYFTGGSALGTPGATPLFHNPFQSSYTTAQTHFPQRAPSPQRNVYGMAQPRHNQLLHVVLFKCARADVFYIQEGTGLTVKPGDLVIVEADRGTDLGTVAKGNVDWQTARDLKEHYAEEQYKWLMMYSQGAAAAQEGSGAGLLASSAGMQGSAIGGMGPASQHHMQEPGNGELRPKLIKRLAQNHEIFSLREKEGQEAKAKRVCMQKVKEHNLNMEILDAEFQMDWKKLTFYYFADAYINFNSLVTDLFKIYKTRIWMSAINPASFASPTLGIQAPSGIGPGAEQQTPGFPQAGRGLRPGFNQPSFAERAVPPPSGYPPAVYGYGQAATFGNPRAGGAYAPSSTTGLDGLAGNAYQTPGDMQGMHHRFGSAQVGPGTVPHSQGVSSLTGQAEWTSAFQGLSLNSH